MHRSLLYLFLGLLSISLHAQHKIRGKVIDFNTNEPLAFANIIGNNNPNLQTTSDINGDFSFESSIAIFELRTSYVGYLVTDINTKTVSGNTILITMLPSINNLDEIKITPRENPANRIIINAINNKEINNPEHIKSFKYQCYNKLLGNLKWNTQEKIDTVAWNNFIKGKHLFLMENVTERKFLAPDYSEETVIASKTSGFQNATFTSLATDIQPFAFYEDNIKLLNVYYLNPISKGSLKKYNFKLEETILKDQDTVFVISFKPKKHKNFDGLKGVLYINSNRYAIQNVIASTYEKSTIQLKIQQQYQWINNQYWFPDQLNYVLKFENFSNYKGVSTVVEGKSYISQVLFDVPLRHKDFALETVLIAEDAAKKDSLFWNNARVQRLDSKELKTYVFLDSIGKKNDFDKKLHIIRKIIDNKISASFVDIDLSRTMQFNEYEGIRIGTGLYTNEKFSKNFIIGGFFGYGQHDDRWKYGLETSYQISKKNELTVGLRHQDNLTEMGNYGLQHYKNDFFNMRRFMASQFDQIRQNTALIGFRILRYLKCQMTINQTDSKPLYALNTMSINTTAYKNTDAAIFFRYAYKEKIIQFFDSNYSAGTPYPIVNAYLSKGLKTFDGNLDYWKIEMAVEQSFFTKNIGKSDYRFEIGYIDHDLPIGLLFTGEGSYHPNYPFIGKNTFQTMTPYEFVSDQYTNLFLSHNFGTLLLKTKIMQPVFSIHHNSGWGKLANHQDFDKINFKTKEKIFFESGLQIDNIIKLNFRNLGYLGIGAAAFYRYGYYSLPNPNDNVAYKGTLNFTIK